MDAHPFKEFLTQEVRKTYKPADGPYITREVYVQRSGRSAVWLK